MQKEIGKILKECRISAKMTVKEISEILINKGYKASESTIYSWENENSQPTPGAFLVMCGAYGIKNVLTTFGYNGYNSDGSIKLNIKEIEHIEKYRDLDDYGKETIDMIMKREYERSVRAKEATDQIESLKRQSATILELPAAGSPYKRLAEYYHSASAGSGVFILGNESSEKISVPATPENAIVDYVIKVSGDSMEPDYHDGDNVMVSQRVEMRHGDVGIFVVNGKAYIKEYGETELISRNPLADNIRISEHDNIVCMGKVVGKLEGPYEIISD